MVAFQRGAHQGNQFWRRTRFGAKTDIESRVFVFRLGHSADHDHGYVWFNFVQGSNKYCTACAGHNVVGHDGSDSLARIAAQQRERALGSGGHIDLHPGITQDRLSHPELQGVVVDQQNSISGYWIRTGVYRRQGCSVSGVQAD
jgi:hypothetical protein